MCLITNQTKIMRLALYMQNYRWLKIETMHCIILIRISKRSVFIPLIGLYNTPYYDVESVGGVFYFIVLGFSRYF
jgi:hypothetical protein